MAEYVQGLRELQARLAKLPEKVEQKILKQATLKAAENVANVARAKAPVDTGLLVSEIGVKNRLSKRNRTIGAQVSVGKPAFYARFLEFGHRMGKRVRGGGKKYRELVALVNNARPFVPARPFLRPAADETKDQNIEIIKREIADKLESVAKQKA